LNAPSLFFFCLYKAQNPIDWDSLRPDGQTMRATALQYPLLKEYLEDQKEDRNWLERFVKDSEPIKKILTQLDIDSDESE